ncbi:MAG: DNA polymerase III subunit delta' [Clostridia bacterium]|nr:DNA polymerase III subunit delta' [Clostridia bacterium]
MRPFPIKAREALITQIMRPVRAGRIVHAMIFAGPAGTGRKTAAKYVAQTLCCDAKAGRPCGVCASCRRFRDSNAPELITLAPDPKEIKIEAVRALLEEISLRPEGKMKCVIIEEADRMNPFAQNALLKTLEEPPEYAVFFLITQHPSVLLPTIRSRCTLVRFAPLEDEEVEEILINRGVSEERARSIAPMARGCAGKAIAISEDAEYPQKTETLLNAMKDLKTERDVASVGPAIAGMRDDEKLLSELLEECAQELMHEDVRTPLARTLQENGIDGAALMQAVIGFVRMRASNVSFQYAAEMLLYNMLKPV